ncbi:MAG: TlpA family protein disulfide reductase [Burkholderiaceae bacterium]|nr:TlpA family protein disulfide reductase [Burkholderiaceae bacterium]
MNTDTAPAAIAPRRRRLLLTGVAAAAGAAGLGLALWRGQGQPAAGASGPAGDASAAGGGSAEAGSLWSLRFERPEGGELVMATLRGQPLIVNFWATWCKPCVREMPEIDRFHREHRARGWQVVGLAIDGPTPVREFLTRVPVGFAIGLAGLDGTDLVRELGNPQGGLPFTVAFDAQGRIRHRKLGETGYDELAGWARGG